MVITDLRLKNFRTYLDGSFEFNPGVNIIVGPNASGKTNLVEAIAMLAGLNSWRARLAATISFNKPWSRLDAHTPLGQRTLKITLEPASKLFEIDGSSYKRLPAGRRLPLCLFEPNHLLILSGPPDLRRDYLDNLAEQIYPEFGLARRKYQRTLAQRNSLLKSGSANVRDQIFGWNVRLAELAGQIMARRQKLIERINRDITKLYQSLATSKDKINLRYVSPLNLDTYETSLIKKLEAGLDEELRRGFSLFGPHRDDLEVIINNRSAGLSASRGETRTLTLALKIIEAKTLEDTLEQKPLMLLDDVFSELDGARRQKLTRELKGYQSFITTTDADVVVRHFTTNTNIIPLQK